MHGEGSEQAAGQGLVSRAGGLAVPKQGPGHRGRAWHQVGQAGVKDHNVGARGCRTLGKGGEKEGSMDSASGFLPSCHPCPAHQACWGSGSLGHSHRKPAAPATPSASHSPYSISWSPHPMLSMSQAQLPLKDHHPHPRMKHREMSKAGEGSLGTPGGLAQRLPFWPPKDEATKRT